MSPLGHASIAVQDLLKRPEESLTSSALGFAQFAAVEGEQSGRNLEGSVLYATSISRFRKANRRTPYIALTSAEYRRLTTMASKTQTSKTPAQERVKVAEKDIEAMSRLDGFALSSVDGIMLRRKE